MLWLLHKALKGSRNIQVFALIRAVFFIFVNDKKQDSIWTIQKKIRSCKKIFKNFWFKIILETK